MAHVGSESGSGQDVELNLAPIIDCFTVLIAFIMISASYATIGVMDAGVAAGSATESKEPPPPIEVKVEIGANQMLKLIVSGKENRTVQIPSVKKDKEQELDIASLSKHLGQVKEKWPKTGGVTLIADNAVPYKQVVVTMNSIRQVIPGVLLGGF
jgi:biopolymer transport protein ExbD